MADFFDLHRPTLEAAVAALAARTFWTPYPEVPSGKIYGETAKTDAESVFDAILGQDFDLPGHPEQARIGAEVSPFDRPLACLFSAVIQLRHRAWIIYKSKPDSSA